MRCYKCNSVLGDSDYCIKCGADVSIYKVVVKASNSYYNLGLAKAQVRDLSGAVTALKTSIKINKNNVKARNLLGLVYYEMGEVARALSEWVISTNIKQDKNVATVYIRKIKSDPNKLEEYNQAAKKYNMALEKAKEKGEDVALIQLKKVIIMNPKFIRAQLLLALIYMQNKEDDRAVKILQKVLKIDRNNTLALRYMDEINKTGIALVKNYEDDYEAKKRSIFKERLSGNDVIIPRNSYKEPSSGILTVVYILLGVIIGVAIIWFLVVPAKLQSSQNENNKTIKEYSEKLAADSITIDDLNSKVDDVTEKLNTATKELEAYQGDTGVMAMYTKLVEAASNYVVNKFDEAATLIAEIDVTQLPTDTAKSLYTTIEENCADGAQTFYIAGVNAYNQRNYAEAITNLEKSYTFDNTKVETVYYLAMTYYASKDTVNAQKYTDIINKQFGTTTYAEQLAQYLKTR